MVYQIRHTNGFKLAEYDLAEEVVYFLKDGPIQHYEVWVLSSEPPSDLKGIYSASEFYHRRKETHENCAGRTISG